MDAHTLRKEEVDAIAEHVSREPMTLAVIRTSAAPTELRRLFETLSSALGLSLHRNIWSPGSDFGFAEFYSNGRMLVVLYIGGVGTELVSVSEVDEVFIRDIESTVCDSNIQSSSIRDGL